MFNDQYNGCYLTWLDLISPLLPHRRLWKWRNFICFWINLALGWHITVRQKWLKLSQKGCLYMWISTDAKYQINVMSLHTHTHVLISLSCWMNDGGTANINNFPGVTINFMRCNDFGTNRQRALCTEARSFHSLFVTIHDPTRTTHSRPHCSSVSQWDFACVRCMTNECQKNLHKSEYAEKRKYQQQMSLLWHSDQTNAYNSLGGGKNVRTRMWEFALSSWLWDYNKIILRKSTHFWFDTLQHQRTLYYGIQLSQTVRLNKSFGIARAATDTLPTPAYIALVWRTCCCECCDLFDGRNGMPQPQSIPGIWIQIQAQFGRVNGVRSSRTLFIVFFSLSHSISPICRFTQQCWSRNKWNS